MRFIANDDSPPLAAPKTDESKCDARRSVICAAFEWERSAPIRRDIRAMIDLRAVNA